MADLGVTKKFKAIVAAARRVDVSTSAAIQNTISKRKEWQEEIWAYYDEVPEVKYALNFLANGMQKVRFFAGVRSEDGKTIIPIDDDGSPLKGSAIAKAANMEMSRVRNGVSGQGEINRLLTLNLEAPGECHLHGMQAIPPSGIPGQPDFNPGRVETWDVRSVSEVEVTDQHVIDPVTGLSRPKIIIHKAPGDKGTEFDPNNETLIRFWQRHPRYTEWADSLLRGCMSDCEMLTLLTGEAKAISKSRHTAGAFTLPSELSFVDDTDAGDEPQEDEQGKGNPFIEAFMRHQTEPITDPSSPSSVQRLVISGPAEFLKPDVLRTIDLSRPADDKLTEKIDRHINRLARGVNVPVEVVMGHMSTTFSNAEQIDQDVFDDHFEPRCIAIGDGYATGFLRPQLEDAGYDIEQTALIEVGYDASALVRDESMDEKATELLDHNAISMEAYRRYKGATEADAPTEQEQLLWMATHKGSFGEDLTGALLLASGISDIGIAVPDVIGQNTTDRINSQQPITTDAPGQPPAVQPAPPAPAPPQNPPAAIAAAARNPGRILAHIDRALRLRLAGAADMAMLRALERAGNKLKTAGPNGLRASLRNVPPRRCAAHLGPALLADTGLTPDDLLDGAWADLGEQFKAWAAQAGESALATVSDMLSGGLTPGQRHALNLRQIDTVDDAWTWLSSSLSDIAKKALFDPVLEPSPLGELDTLSHVPTSILREALIRAGGGTGFRSSNGAITPTNNVPLGGVATGENIMDTLATNGVGVDTYVWVYGPAQRRTFQPHADLDGTPFENFDDPALLNTEGWPETTFYYPGDHDGCVCDFDIILGSQSSPFSIEGAS